MALRTGLVGNSAQLAEGKPGRGTEASTKRPADPQSRDTQGAWGWLSLALMFASLFAQCTVPHSGEFWISHGCILPKEGACWTRRHVLLHLTTRDAPRTAHSLLEQAVETLRASRPRPPRAGGFREQGSRVQRGWPQLGSRLLGAHFSASRSKPLLVLVVHAEDNKGMQRRIRGEPGARCCRQAPFFLFCESKRTPRTIIVQNAPNASGTRDTPCHTGACGWHAAEERWILAPLRRISCPLCPGLCPGG